MVLSFVIIGMCSFLSYRMTAKGNEEFLYIILGLVAVFAFVFYTCYMPFEVIR